MSTSQKKKIEKEKNHTGEIHLWTMNVNFKFLRILLSLHFTQTKQVYLESSSEKKWG